MKKVVPKRFDISKPSLEKFLSEREGAPVKVLRLSRLGSGWHGTGYRISYVVRGKSKEAVLRMINPLGFSHDYPSDRASVFLLQNSLFNSIPKHVKSIDVGGCAADGSIVSLGDSQEFFQIVEVADGIPYAEDLERILRVRALKKGDIDKAISLSDHLVLLHRRYFKGAADRERSLKLRHLRDVVGHGEMLTGVIDTYPAHVSWIDDELLSDIICRAVKFNFRIRDLPIPLVAVHGDYHPGNIWFTNEKDFALLDASRVLWGLAADDITALTINYIRFSLLDRGRFDGPFKELFMAFWENYRKKTGDKFLPKVVAPFFAFRGLVVAHPLFYPSDNEGIKVKLIKFVLNILEEGEFDPIRMNSYLEVI